MEIEELSKKEIKIIKELWRGEKEKVNELSRNIETSYSHVHKRLKKLEKKDLIESKKHGRSKFVKLSYRGNKLARKLQEIEEI